MSFSSRRLLQRTLDFYLIIALCGSLSLSLTRGNWMSTRVQRSSRGRWMIGASARKTKVYMRLAWYRWMSWLFCIAADAQNFTASGEWVSISLLRDATRARSADYIDRDNVQMQTRANRRASRCHTRRRRRRIDVYRFDLPMRVSVFAYLLDKSDEQTYVALRAIYDKSIVKLSLLHVNWCARFRLYIYEALAWCF